MAKEINTARTRYTAFIFLGAAGLAVVIGLLFHMMNVNAVSRYPEPGAALASVAPTTMEERYTYWSSINTPFFRVSDQSNPLLVVIGKRQYTTPRSEDKNGVYVSFYDILEKKRLKEVMIARDKDLGGGGLTLRTFSNGDIYFILDGKKIYRINRSRLDAEEVTRSLFGGQPKLKAGWSAIAFQPDNAGDGLSIQTRDGVNYAYYPLVGRLYSEDQVDEAGEGFRNLIEGGKDSLYFTFTTHSFDFPDEKLQLLKVRYKDNNGGPQNIRFGFNWRRDYAREHGGNGLSGHVDPYTKVLISKDVVKELRITGYKDITPGRLYFDPRVMYGDDDHLLIVLRVSAAQDASFSLQSLDPNTGAVQWTQPMGDDKPDRVLPMAGGYVLVNRNSTRCIDTAGKTISEFKIN
jgi:hypothetical protein